MRACLLALLMLTSPAIAEDQLLSGGELGELRYACFGDDAEEMAGSVRASNQACAQWDEIVAKAKKAGLCLNDTSIPVNPPLDF